MHDYEEKKLKKRVTVTVSNSTYCDLLALKEENDLSVDKNASKLIEQAIKERKRKRKNAKEDNT